MHGRVVNFYGQLNPGKPKQFSPDGDTRQGRFEWLRNCLDQLHKHLQDHEGVSVAFPARIGCDMAGGNWKQYLCELRLFAQNHPTWKVVIYDFQPETRQTIPEPPVLNKEIEAIVKDRVKNRIQKKRQSKKVVMSTSCKHNIFTHFPKDKDCPICTRNKPMKAPSRSKSERDCDALPEPIKFGDSGMLDHKVINDDDKSRSEDRNVCVILDRAIYWLQAYADKIFRKSQTVGANPQVQSRSGLVEHAVPVNSKCLCSPTAARKAVSDARRDGKVPVFIQDNPKIAGTKSYWKYEHYKSVSSFDAFDALCKDKAAYHGQRAFRGRVVDMDPVVV